VLFVFVVLRLVFTVLSQEIDWVGRLRNDLFCVEMGRKTWTQSVSWVGYISN